MVDENGDQFVAYFLPTPETLEKRTKDVDAPPDEINDEMELVLNHPSTPHPLSTLL